MLSQLPVDTEAALRWLCQRTDGTLLCPDPIPAGYTVLCAICTAQGYVTVQKWEPGDCVPENAAALYFLLPQSMLV